MGAGWIHGRSGNPLTRLARTANVSVAPFDYDAQARYTSRGRLGDGVEAAAEGTLQRLLNTAGRRADQLDADVPLGRLLPALSPLLENLVVTEIEQEYAADVNELSAFWWDEGRSERGGDLLVSGGYVRILAALAQGLDMRTGHRVLGLSGASGGVVTWGGWGRLDARAAILTVPLSLLKRGVPRIEPSLPAGHASAAAALGMGTLDKLVLRFPRVFWDSTLQTIDIETPHQLFAEWINLQPFLGMPVLVGWNAGRRARALSRLPTRQLVALAREVLALAV